MRILMSKNKRILAEWLPPYAPDLNPVEQVWNRSKNVELANFIPVDAKHLGVQLDKALVRQSRRRDLLLSYFKHAGLKL